MERGGGWLSSDGGPSAELEAIWGPGARSASSRPGDTGAEAERRAACPTPADIVVAPAAPRWRSRSIAVATSAVVAVVASVSAAAFFAASGRGDATVSAAATGSGDADDRHEDLTASARAFVDRWNAGPSTTMPLGVGAVPVEERHATTPSTTRAVAPATTVPSTKVAPTLSPDDPRLRGAEASAQEFANALMDQDCEAVWRLLSTPTLELFAEMEAESGHSMKAELCNGLAEEHIPRIEVRPPAQPHGRDGALVALEADGETEHIAMLLEGDRWTVDLFGVFG